MHAPHREKVYIFILIIRPIFPPVSFACFFSFKKKERKKERKKEIYELTSGLQRKKTKWKKGNSGKMGMGDGNDTKRDVERVRRKYRNHMRVRKESE